MNTSVISLRRESGNAGNYLALLGNRVRAWRAEHGVTRKALASASGVSERYLAQLEDGQGNISILLLRNLTIAMNIPIEDLVRAAEAPAAPIGRRGRIALIGLRGAGKSTLGTFLAKTLDVPFIELDREVEREAGACLADIFAIYGQKGFRRFEHRALTRVVARNDRAVIAIGGGLVTDSRSYEHLLATCYCVWLKATPKEHMARVLAQGDMRPMQGRAAAMTELRQILAERKHLYARADAIVDNHGKTVKQSSAELRRVIPDQNS